jgi:hypothetical protein
MARRPTELWLVWADADVLVDVWLVPDCDELDDTVELDVDALPQPLAMSAAPMTSSFFISGGHRRRAQGA